MVLRQFYVEGLVNQYAEEAPGPEAEGSVVFTTEAIENIPAGFCARETSIVHGTDEFEEIFELAKPGQPFKTYARAILKRKKENVRRRSPLPSGTSEKFCALREALC